MYGTNRPSTLINDTRWLLLHFGSSGRVISAMPNNIKWVSYIFYYYFMILLLVLIYIYTLLPGIFLLIVTWTGVTYYPTRMCWGPHQGFIVFVSKCRPDTHSKRAHHFGTILSRAGPAPDPRVLTIMVYCIINNVHLTIFQNLFARIQGRSCEKVANLLNSDTAVNVVRGSSESSKHSCLKDSSRPWTRKLVHSLP